MTLFLCLVLAFSQAEELLRKLAEEDPQQRERAQAELLKMGRTVYPALRPLLDSSDPELKARSRGIAYGLGIDPETHRPWEELWKEYQEAPAEDKRRTLVGLGARIEEPRLTLLRKVDAGIFKEVPECAWGSGLVAGEPVAPEWDVLDEVLLATLKENSKAFSESVASLLPAERVKTEAFTKEWKRGGKERAWTLFAWGVHLLQGGASRTDARAAWRAQLRICPGSSYEAQVKGYVDTLDRMIREDEEKRFEKRSVKSVAMSPAEEADYWVFCLRDACAHQDSQPGYCHILEAKEPAPDKLLKLGKAAIPALIGCLGDMRLTRTVGFWRDFSPHRNVLTYHDAAIQILDAITGLSLFERASTSDYPSLGQKEKLTRIYKDWWEKAKDREPSDWWKEWLEADGEHSRAPAAQRLLQAQGQKAIPSVLKALEKSKDYDRANIIHLLGAAKGDDVAQALRQILERNTSDRQILRSLAQSLAAQNDTAGLEKLRKLVEQDLKGGASSWDLRDDLRTLAASGRFEFVKVPLLAVQDRTLEVSGRAAALSSLEDFRPVAEAERREALRGMAPLLGDRTEVGSTTSYGNGIVVKTRFCDEAAKRLSEWFPGSVTFKEDVAENERDDQISKIREWASRAVNEK
jgi:HEAT repeat protein